MTTTRHEDDLRAEAYANGGAVPLASLLDHLDMVVQHPEVHGQSVTEPLRALILAFNSVREDFPEYFPATVFLRTTEM